MTSPVSPNQVLESCPSTNDLARVLGDLGHPHGTWISSRHQTAGRGRLGRSWESSSGNLFLSVLFRSENRSHWTWVPLLTAIGIARAIRGLNAEADVRIKWPNDLWIGQGAHGAKLGGILCEAVGSREQAYMIVGIGLNCASSPQGLDQRTISLQEAVGSGGSVSVEDLRPAVLKELDRIYMELAAQGPGKFVSEFEALAAFPRGTLVEWGAGFSGTIQGLGSAGELIVTLQGGASRKLYAEDVRLRVARTAADGSPA